MQATKERRQQLIHPDFETHAQSHPKSKTEHTRGPTKWTSVQQKIKKKKRLYCAFTEILQLLRVFSVDMLYLQLTD